MKDSSLQKLHDVELEILDEIVRICSKHDLKYYIVGGTLLGAVRHKGFIPWDDDLDIGMPREDYKKFCKICEKELNNSYYLHSSAIDPEYWLPFVKVRKKDTVFDEGKLKNVTNKFNGIWVDIFPLDYAEKASSNSKRLRTFIYKQISYLISYRSQKRLPNKKSSLLLYCLTKNFKVSTFRRIQDKLMQWENQKKNVEYYVNYASQYNTMKQTMHRTIYDPACELQFCGRMYLAPANYHSFLLQLYGDNYMLYPPFEKRRTHDPLRLSFDISGEDEILDHAKHYKVGYTTGVFDLFHVGHLNILKLAKEQCDYLIVGVSTDENVQSYKHKKPVIPFEQRVKIVESIRYVDQVVPQINMDKLEAWHKYHFEVMFHGSDWKGSSMYDDITRRLKEVGCDMVFLPHTSGVSSSMLCEKMDSEKQ